MRIPESVLEEIKSRFDIAQFISRYVDLKKAGANHKGLCPFHQEKTPSFMVSASKGIFKCFGCGAGGNLFTFLRDVENISFYEAVRILAQEASIDITQYGGKEAEQHKSENERLFKLNEAARAFFQESLKGADAAGARSYLDKRALKAEIVSQFSLGFAPASGEALLNRLKFLGFSEEDGVKAGLLVKRDDGRVYDKFRNRVMIPIVNLSGLFAGFTGRVLNDNDNPKYLNSPETPVFQKGKLLFGLFAGRDAIRKEGCVFVVEGNVDLLTLVQGEVRNVVATSGTAFTETQALLLKRFCEQAVIVYDGDNAGQNAAQRGIPVLINAGLRVRIAVLPWEEDPDSYFKKVGREAFLAEINRAKDVPDFVMELFGHRNDLSVAENKVKAVAEFAPFLQAVDNPILRSEWVRKVALHTGLREDMILGKAVNNRVRNVVQAKVQAENGAPAATSETMLEEAILGLLIRDFEAHFPLVSRHLQETDFSDPACRMFFRLLIERNGFDPAMLNEMDGELGKNLSRLVLEAGVQEVKKSADTEMHDLILKIRGNRIKRQRSEIKRRMALPGEDKEKLMVEFNALTQEINGLKESSLPPD